MKCPALLAGGNAQPSSDMTTSNDCLKEECGIWDKDGNQCAGLGILEELTHLCDHLKALVEKMSPKSSPEG